MRLLTNSNQQNIGYTWLMDKTCKKPLSSMVVTNQAFQRSIWFPAEPTQVTGGWTTPLTLANLNKPLEQIKKHQSNRQPAIIAGYPPWSTTCLTTVNHRKTYSFPIKNPWFPYRNPGFTTENPRVYRQAMGLLYPGGEHPMDHAGPAGATLRRCRRRNSSAAGVAEGFGDQPVKNGQ